MAAKILRLVCICLSVLTVMLCGCAEKDAPQEEIVPDFRADFTADYRGMRLGGSVTATRQGVYSLRFTEPPTLNGLQIRRQNGVLTLRRGDAAATADEPYLPEVGFPSVLCALLQTAAKGEVTAQGNNAFTLALPCGEATLTVDENCLPQSAAVPGADCSLTFLNSEPLE